MTDMMNTFKNMFLGVFMNPAGAQTNPNVSPNAGYAKQFFNADKFQGSWKEVSRTANPFQEFNGEEAVHKFKIYNDKINYKLSQGDNKVKHALTVDSQHNNLCFNNFLGHPRTNVFGIYDQNLNLATDNSQDYAYCILCNDDKFWMLSRPDCEDNSQAINHMTNFCQKLGYKPTYTCNKYRVNHLNASEKNTPFNTPFASKKNTPFTSKKNTPRQSRHDDFLDSLGARQDPFENNRYMPKNHHHDKEDCFDARRDSYDESKCMSKKNTPRHSQHDKCDSFDNDDFIDSLGYKSDPREGGRYMPKNHNHESQKEESKDCKESQQDSSDESKSQDCDVMVLWNCDSFPSDGSGRLITVKQNDVIRFKSTDNQAHTVAQCQIIKDGNELSGFKWVPHSDPKIGSPDDSDEFNKTLTISEPGVYYLVCPVGTNHRCMRLRVDVEDY